ncbi:MAG: hypothetical protein CMO80_00250 [Verrucomicrobiales bacterium]|nr:hypothetical protein [Verrucomicrobiales bacterium]
MDTETTTSPLLVHLEQFAWLYLAGVVVLFLISLFRIMLMQQTQLKLLETLTREIVESRNDAQKSVEKPDLPGTEADESPPKSADVLEPAPAAKPDEPEQLPVAEAIQSQTTTVAKAPASDRPTIKGLATESGSKVSPKVTVGKQASKISQEDAPVVQASGATTTTGDAATSESGVPGAAVAAKSAPDPKVKSAPVSPKPDPETIRKRLGSVEAMLEGLTDEESTLELNRKLAYLQAELDSLQGDDALDLPADELRNQMQMATRLKKFIQQKHAEGMAAENPTEFALEEINRLEKVVDDISDCVDEHMAVGCELAKKKPVEEGAGEDEESKVSFGGSKVAHTASGKFEIGFGTDINRVEKTLNDINEYVEQQLAIGSEVTGLEHHELTEAVLNKVASQAKEAAQNLSDRQHELAAGFLNRDLAFVDGQVDVSSDLIGFCRHRKPDSTLMTPERPSLCQFANREGPLHNQVISHLEAVGRNCETLQAQREEQKELVDQARDLLQRGKAGDAEKLLNKVNPAFTDLGAEDLRNQIDSWQKRISAVETHLENLKTRVNNPWPAPFAKPWQVTEFQNEFYDEAEAIGQTIYTFQQELIEAECTYTDEGIKRCRRLDTRLHSIGDNIAEMGTQTRDKSMIGLLLLLLLVFGVVSYVTADEYDNTKYYLAAGAFLIPGLYLLHTQLLKRTSVVFELETNGRAVDDDDIAFIKLNGKRFVSGNRLAPGTYQLTLDKSIYEPIAQRVKIRYGRRNVLGAIPVRLARDTYVNCLEMKFVPIPGTTVMFSIWQTRVKDFRAYVRDKNEKWSGPRFIQDDLHPAVNTSYEDARRFCIWLTERERKAGRIGHRDEYRLPTDIEWSAAVELPHETGETPAQRNGKMKDIFPWGQGKWPPPMDFANLDTKLEIDPFDHTSKVGSFAPNRHGLYDLCGNVWEWCDDLFDPRQKNRTARGGSWHTAKREMCLSSYRLSDSPGHRVDIIGFRCVLEIRKPSPLFRLSAHSPEEEMDSKG